MSISTETVMWLLPVTFMFHDLEEIIMMKPWLKRNSRIILSRFPLSARYISHMQKISTSSFAMMVALEFLVISAATFISVVYAIFYLWAAVFLVFTIHLAVHIIQFIIFRRYVPVIITSVVSFIYCFYVIQNFFTGRGDYTTIMIWTVATAVVTGIFFALIQKFAIFFENRIVNKNSDNREI